MAGLTPGSPTPQSITVHGQSRQLELVFSDGADSYPIINYEYAIVNAKQASPETAKAIREEDRRYAGR